MTPASPLVEALTAWFDEHERPLPWRRTTPWGVMVSEFMLQQTPVDRVLPLWHTWLDRWPTPAALAADAPGEAIRAWGRLGYPRRARRLHESATLIVERHGGDVPEGEEDLLALPGVGDYTAAAIRAFAFGQRSIVLDTNIRRVISRNLDGQATAPGSITRGEWQRADDLWPRADAASARWSAAVMEFGALVCTARAPSCSDCPVIDTCAWTSAGQPADDSARRQPRYEGSDREVRGRLLQVLRDSDASVTHARLAKAWPDAEQRERALAGLLADGLLVSDGRNRYRLP
jgi:A/G-specific adenine glycosylase